MTKIKVNINKPDPPKEVIHKYKNFDNFMDTYQKLHTQEGIRDMWYRDRKKLAFIAVIISLLLIWLFSENEQSEKDQNEKPKTEQVDQK